MVFEVQVSLCGAGGVGAATRRHYHDRQSPGRRRCSRNRSCMATDLVIRPPRNILAGHSDTVLRGVVAGSRRRTSLKINRLTYPYLGAQAFAVRDLAVAARACARCRCGWRSTPKSGLVLAERLGNHPAVARVRHPALMDHPGRAFDWIRRPVCLRRGGDDRCAGVCRCPGAYPARCQLGWPGDLDRARAGRVATAAGSNSFVRFGVSDRTIRFCGGP